MPPRKGYYCMPLQVLKTIGVSSWDENDHIALNYFKVE